MEHQYALGKAIDSIECLTMQREVEMGDRADRLPEGRRANVDFGAFEASGFNQQCCYDPADDLQDRHEDLGMCTGAWGMT